MFTSDLLLNYKKGRLLVKRYRVVTVCRTSNRVGSNKGEERNQSNLEVPHNYGDNCMHI